MAFFGSGPELKFEETLSGPQSALRDQLLGLVGGQLGRGFELPDMVTGASGLQQGAFDRAGQFLGAGGPGFGGARSRAILDMIQGRPSFTVDPATRQQFFQDQLAPAQQAFQDSLGNVAERFAGIGATGDLSRALAREAGRFGDRQTAVAAGLTQQDVMAQRQAQEAAAGRRFQGLQAGMNEALTPINLGLQAGGVQRGIANQLQAQTGQQQLARNNPFFNPALNFLGTAITPTRAAMTTPGSPGLAGPLLGIGGSLLGGALGGPGGALLGGSFGGGLGGAL